MLNGALDGERQLVHVEGLREEIEGAGPQREDGGLHAAEARHDDDRDIGPALDDAFAKLDAADAAHVEVRHDDVDVTLGEAREGCVGALRRLRGEASGG